MKTNKFGWLGIIIIVAIPLLTWIFMTPLSTRFANFNSTMRSLGQITGLIGMILFSLTLILSTRLRFIENLFGGFDKAYKAHHLLGAGAFILLLFHPVFLALRYLFISVYLAATSLLPINSFEVNIGIFSLLSMILFLAFTFIIKIPYHYWKITHQFLGVSYLLGIVHVFLIQSDISRNMLLRVYIFFFIILGLAAYIYRPLLSRFLVDKARYKVKSIKNLHETILEIALEPEKKENTITHCPGQFIYLSFKQKGISSEFHPFTISSSSELKLAIKSLGDFTSQLKDLKIGTLALIEGPYGKFCPVNYNKNQIWIAAGIGITPFLSMAEHLEQNKISADLFYSARDRKEAIFLDELKKLASKNKNFKLIPYFTSEKGRLDSDFIIKNSDLTNKEIFICGPAQMMNTLKKDFIKSGIKKERIHIEEFQMI